MLNALDEVWMQRALAQAALGMNTTTPNPRVGCVLVDATGQFLAEGFHLRAGEPHAEVMALRAAVGKTAGATAYVTLEPCNHQGRTGPCTEALLQAGISRVVYAMQDPNPRVAGAGIRRLMAAGILVEGPLLEAEAQALNRGFARRMTQGRPWVTCKLAMSLDGRTAMASGESQWITGPKARSDVQALRARSCAIVTGVNTVIADDPALTWREPLGQGVSRQPLRVVLDSQLRTPEDAAILRQPGETLIATGVAPAAHSALQAYCQHFDLDAEGRLPLPALLAHLAARGCNEVLIESGAKLAGSFLAAGLIDELVLYIAGTLMGSSARPLFELPLVHMSDRIPLAIHQFTPLGDDWKMVAHPVYRD
jgi:diaminohydroxyphosphoribosylaminopyrimidine deaminase / 5-amino-6-(5-phosphoribosylamino)uracil reductase